MQNIITLSFIAFSVLLILLSLPLMFNKIKPNWWYGFRTPASVKNPEIWYPVNQAAAKQSIVLGILMIIVSLGLYSIGDMTVDATLIINSLVATTGLLVIAIKGVVTIRKLSSK